jgi:hypothetical protein
LLVLSGLGLLIGLAALGLWRIVQSARTDIGAAVGLGADYEGLGGADQGAESLESAGDEPAGHEPAGHGRRTGLRLREEPRAADSAGGREERDADGR